MAEEKKEVAQKQEFNTSLSDWTNAVTGLIDKDFKQCGVEFDEYSKRCAMSAMGSIFQLVQNTDKAKMSELNMSNLREIVEQCASLKLNANAVPREVYFSLRSKQAGVDENGRTIWQKFVEMGIEGDGNDALLRQFGNEVAKVHPCWIVKEGDEFTRPKRVGMEITPPSWEQKGLSEKVVAVVYPVQLTNGSIEYLIAERESVKTNLIAHIRNNMMNETFGVCKDRYKATPEQKQKIKEMKNQILSDVRSCETLDDMLKCPSAQPYISAAWLDTPEQMITRKLRNNAIKKFPKDMNSMANHSLLQLDEGYKASREEITENENSEPFKVDEGEVVDSEAVEVGEPDFVKESEL